MKGERTTTSTFPLAVGLNAARDTARLYLLKQISATVGWMPWLLHLRCRGPWLTAFARAATFCGEEEFYFLAVPAYMWFCDVGNGLALVLLFAFNLYLGNWLKNWFCLPRPPLQMRWDWERRAAENSAAALDQGLDDTRDAHDLDEDEADATTCASRAAAASGDAAGGSEAEAAEAAPASCSSRRRSSAEELTEAQLLTAAKDVDFGWPSTHSMNAVALPFYLLRCSFPIAVWDYPEPTRMWIFGLSATAWALSVSVSRVYLGVHSPADVQGGMMLGAIVLRLWLSVHNALTAWLTTGFNGVGSSGGGGHCPNSGCGLVGAAADVAGGCGLEGAAGAGAVLDALSSPGEGLFSPGELLFSPGEGQLCPGGGGVRVGLREGSLDMLLFAAVASVLLILAHPVVQPRTTTFFESVMLLGFTFGFVVGAHVSGGNAAAPTAAEHLAKGNVLACVLVGGAIVGVVKVGSRRAACALVRCAPARRLVHASLLALPLCALLRSLALVDVPTNLGVLFAGMCAAVYFLEVREGERQSAADSGLCAFGSDTLEAVVAKFANYASVGLALTLAVPAAFQALGLR
ncbi:hypothetical protein T492DRAFT_1003372 [Pavlovales sp. CCMP2436]|nr:hypothetical protein T492DRAFT_1003372 [Pavlovales sp. CCMP2436]